MLPGTAPEEACRIAERLRRGAGVVEVPAGDAGGTVVSVTLSVQGGPMSAAEAREFESSPYAASAVRVRRWDDQAKDPAAVVPGFGHYQPLLAELITVPRH